MLIGLGRRRGVVDGDRHQHRRPRLRLGAARQRRNPAPRAGGHRPLLAAGRDNPILAIHDVGAGGLSNALPELADRRPRRPLRAARGAIERAGHEPAEIWSNEAQERYVLAIAPESLPAFQASASASAARSRWSAAPPPTATSPCPTATSATPGRHGNAGAARQTAEDDRATCRRRAVFCRLSTSPASPSTTPPRVLRDAAVAEELPDHHRRPQRSAA